MTENATKHHATCSRSLASDATETRIF